MSPAVPQQQCAPSLLLELPEPLLLAVLQCLAAADDHRSLLSAARAHSRLHQAVAAVLTSFTLQGIFEQEVLDGVVAYLGKHGQHARSLSLGGYQEPCLILRQLPPTLQLHELELCALEVQLQPAGGWQGVLGSAAGLSSLKQLQFIYCRLLIGRQGLAAALAQLPPGLEHLTLDYVWLDDRNNPPAAFPTSVLQQGQLQQLTHLELWDVRLQDADQPSLVLQPLQALSRLVEMRLRPWKDDNSGRVTLTADMLSSATGLTRLVLGEIRCEPGALAGSTQLQHLHLGHCQMLGDAAWAAQLQPLQQLTHLNVPDSLGRALQEGTAPPAAYSALTASSKLQHHNISCGTLPAGVWQHVFPVGRQLLHLTSLQACGMRQQVTGGHMAAPEGSRLVSCCPALRSLDVSYLTYSAGVFAPLRGLSGLHTLLVGCATGPSATSPSEVLGEVCQLTGLRDLEWKAPMGDSELPPLLQTTQLRQLTRLICHRQDMNQLMFVAEGPGDEPVWRQVLQRLQDHSDPAVAQQAAAALAAG